MIWTPAFAGVSGKNPKKKAAALSRGGPYLS